MKIAGLWSGHDCSFYVSNRGKPIVHAEYERYIREKEPAGDSAKFLIEQYADWQSIKHFVSTYPTNKLQEHEESYKKICEVADKNGGSVSYIGHHQAHAANTFFSSNFEEAYILTVDGGGVDRGGVTALTTWKGIGNRIYPIRSFPIHQVNIGGVWTRATRYIFELQSGWPHGHQAGSVMAMAAFGDPKRFFNDFYTMLTVDLQQASAKPSTQPRGALVKGNDPQHPYLHKYQEIAKRGEQDKFDLAAGLQAATEYLFRQLLAEFAYLSEGGRYNLCLAGGVALNSVMVGKLRQWFPVIDGVYITPTPHDGGLTIGAAQYMWHEVLDHPRIIWEDNYTPYLGVEYDKKRIFEDLKQFDDKVSVSKVNDSEVVDLLDKQKIVAVFGGGSESGRRALGNRSILADPRDSEMKDKINSKVKHRQWYRPFAPSILRDTVGDWFENPCESPYMSDVLEFKEEVRDKVPAVVHVNGTARLQTVTEKDNGWYYNFLKLWEEKSGVPIILNTSFNDREPICETPEHAIRCFLGTEIDYLYFVDYGILMERK